MSYHVCHHEQVALIIISRSSGAIIFDRSASRVRTRLFAATETRTPSTLQGVSAALSESCRLHYLRD